jgi:hypothetical protein
MNSHGTGLNRNAIVLWHDGAQLAIESFVLFEAMQHDAVARFEVGRLHFKRLGFCLRGRLCRHFIITARTGLLWSIAL